MKLLASLLLALALAACTTISRMDGDQVINDRLVVHVSSAWNKVSDPWDVDPFDTWTQEGIPLDNLRFWGGLHPGQTLVSRQVGYSRSADAKDPRTPTFRAGLSAENLVALFEEVYAHAGTVTVTKIEPATFAGQPAVRFEFALARRSDDLDMLGVAWIAVRSDPHWGEELYAASFVAPKLSFYHRLLPMAEQVVKTAHIKAPSAPRM
jgi:hypothetical protein